jgi:hypothetical protein
VAEYMEAANGQPPEPTPPDQENEKLSFEEFPHLTAVLKRKLPIPLVPTIKKLTK